LVQRHDKCHRHQHTAEAIEHTAGERVDRAERVPVEERKDRKDDAGCRRSEEGCEEPGIEHHDVDGLHGGSALRRWEAAENVFENSRLPAA
jgi:hypothetical protein